MVFFFIFAKTQKHKINGTYLINKNKIYYYYTIFINCERNRNISFLSCIHFYIYI